MDSFAKISSSTFLTDKTNCDCSLSTPHDLRAKLEEILETLQAEIQERTEQLQEERASNQEALREKDEIIERLVQANEDLSVQNQQLKLSQIRNNQYLQARIKKNQAEYEAERKQLNTIISYLQRKNQELTHKMSALRYGSNNNSSTKGSQILTACKSPTSNLEPISNSKYLVKDEHVYAHERGSNLKKVTSLSHIFTSPSLKNQSNQYEEYSLRHLKRSRADPEYQQHRKKVSRLSSQAMETRVSRNLNMQGWTIPY